MYKLPGCRLETAKRAKGDVKLARISYVNDKNWNSDGKNKSYENIVFLPDV